MAYFTAITLRASRDIAALFRADPSVDSDVRDAVMASNYPRLADSQDEQPRYAGVPLPLLACGQQVGELAGWYYDSETPLVLVPPQSLCVVLSHNQLGLNGETSLAHRFAGIVNRYSRPNKTPVPRPDVPFDQYVRDYFRPLYPVFKNSSCTHSDIRLNGALMIDPDGPVTRDKATHVVTGIKGPR